MADTHGHFYCADDPDIHVKGTQDGSMMESIDHSFIMYEIERCTDAIRNQNKLDSTCEGSECATVDPKCAGSKEMEKWTKRKRIAFTSLN